MKVSRDKNEYICVNQREAGKKVQMQGLEVVKVDGFKNLESTIQNNGQCTKEIAVGVGGDKCQGYCETEG